MGVGAGEGVVGEQPGHGERGRVVKPGDIIGYAILAALVLITLIFSDAHDMEVKAINNRLATL